MFISHISCSFKNCWIGAIHTQNEICLLKKSFSFTHSLICNIFSFLNWQILEFGGFSSKCSEIASQILRFCVLLAGGLALCFSPHLFWGCAVQLAVWPRTAFIIAVFLWWAVVLATQTSFGLFLVSLGNHPFYHLQTYVHRVQMNGLVL